MLFDSVGYAATGGMADFVAALITTIGTNVMSMGIGVIAYVLLTAILRSEETKAILAFLKKDHRKEGSV